MITNNTHPAPAPDGEVVRKPYDMIVKRLLNPPFGTETSERLLMGTAADAIRTLIDENARLAALATAKPETPEHGGVEAVREQIARAVYEAMGFVFEGREIGVRGPFGEWATALKAADAVLALTPPATVDAASPAPANTAGVEGLALVRLGARAMRLSAEASCGNHAEGALEDAMISTGLTKEDKAKLSAEADAAEHIRIDIADTVEDSALGYASYMGDDEDRKALAAFGVTSNWLYRRVNNEPSKPEIAALAPSPKAGETR